MKKIGFKNLRSLKNVDDIEIKPLTIIVGKNSSGKSTFLRSFPLLKQSIETKTNSPILWFDPNSVDYGSFDECLNRNASKENEIVFRYDFNIKSDELFRFSFLHRTSSNFNGNMKIKLHIRKEKDKEYINLIEIGIESSEIEISLNRNSTVEEIIINKKNLTPKGELQGLLINSILPQLIEKNREGFTFNYSQSENIIFSNLNSILGRRVKSETLESMLKKFELGDYDKFYKSLKKKGFIKTWYKRIDLLPKDDPRLIELHNYYLLSQLNFILDQADLFLTNYFNEVYYVAPVRATAERYYRPQGLAVNRIDPRGINLPMFLENLSDSEFKRFQNWTVENFQFKPMIFKIGGHLSISINIDNENINLADTGFGFSQILPIITQLWSIIQKGNTRNKVTKTFVIEQPELHLHPSMQASLVDAFVKVINTATDNKVDIRIIFETHSEVMINRLGQHVAYDKISNEDINIVIFNSNGFETQTQIGNYDENGRLRNWPIGFFYPKKIQ